MGMVDGKAIAVTGAGDGLGRAYARALAAAGARVVVNDLDAAAATRVADEITTAGGEALVCAGSVSDDAVARAIVATCVEGFGRIDGLVNNAAIFHVADPEDESAEAIRRILDVNVVGTFLPAVHAFRAMAAQGSGAIVNVTSGAHLGIRGMTAYGTTKGAVASMVYNLALEGAERGIRVNGLSPLAQTNMGATGARDAGTPSALPDPAQIAPAVVYLMSDAAAHLSGQILRYDGSGVALMVTPNFRTGKVDAGVDDAEGIAAAIAGPLAAEVRPVGLY